MPKAAVFQLLADAEAPSSSGPCSLRFRYLLVLLGYCLLGKACSFHWRQDILPLDSWHTVLMSEAATVPTLSPSSLSLDFQQVERGVPLERLEEFAIYAGFALKDLLEVVIPPRTLKHRKQRKEPLSIDESDRLARVIRLYELGVRVFGDRDKARRWLTKPKIRFEERTPLAMMRTELGGRAVEEMLIQIEEGIFA
jgi:putative toxin-antitoxin system antitoxin component (TIGR02293 family)